jgi:hypothetical protein
MNTIWVLFEHKSAFKTKTMQKIMESGSGGDNVHCEIILPSKKFIRASAWLELGVAFKDFYEVALNADKYEVFVIENVDEEKLWQFHQMQVGKRYDQAGLFWAMFMGWRLKNTNPDRWFCSELNYYELKNIVGLNLPEFTPHHVTPQMLYLLLADLGYKPQKLSEII